MQFSHKETRHFRRVRRLSQMQKMEPITFERYVGWLYQQRGYHVAMTRTSGDEGVDLLLHRWHRKVVVQVKRYSGTVGQPVVRDLYGTMMHEGARAAHLVTTGRFSAQAEAWAAGKPIVLIDGNDLVAWVNKKRRAPLHRERWWPRMLLAALVTTLLLLGGWWLEASGTLDSFLAEPLPATLPSATPAATQPAASRTPRLVTAEATIRTKETPTRAPRFVTAEATIRIEEIPTRPRAPLVTPTAPDQ